MHKVLVVDDEEILRMLIVDTLEDLEGVELRTAENGRDALDLLAAERFDLVILDYMMPLMTGIEVLGELGDELKQKTAILMLTAKAQEADRNKALAAGARFFMAKPFSPMELMHVVEGILSDSGSNL
ncbi:hypothetical protein GCM10010912_37440 [Paenibacillus albidus]|uniref:Response regulatory domain-containing protein n=1 Tax=Paenibacillus albidus TaxID=2041023 RepID=A0A917FLY4_9BACL|nr:response regulator [Paenibacillus albidus]GGF88761.1 hypothetical protein GCM10010912_37440 [Paenibacillus albidus]